MKTCKKHGDYEPEVLHMEAVRGMSNPEEILRPAYDFETGCPACVAEDGARANARAIESALREEAEKRSAIERARLRHFEDMNIEPAYYGASLETFDADTPELAHNLERVRDLIAGKIQKIVMLGSNGTGKTHLACAAVKELQGRILSMYEISTTIRASYTALATRSELDIVDELARLPILAIDEIGRTKGSDTEANWLSYIIDKRHVRGLPLILISNKHARKDCQKSGCPDCLENYIGEDIMSRLCEGGALLKFTGADYRRKSRAVP